MYKDLSKEESDQLYDEVKTITQMMETVNPKASVLERTDWFLELANHCYIHTLCMLRLPALRRAIMTYFENFFVELAEGKATLPLATRDQLNRMYGIMLENKRNLEKDTRCLF
jgi:hypothetical protein